MASSDSPPPRRPRRGAAHPDPDDVRSDEYVYEALRAGASGLLKDTPPEQLVEATAIVARGDALLAPSITRRVIEEFVRRPPASARKPPPELAELTTREREMLGYIAKGLSNAEIARAAFVSETTVKTHVAHILMKLRLRDRVQAVVYAYENGVVQPGTIRRLRLVPRRARGPFSKVARFLIPRTSSCR
jgi:DNA-binding NarL/FixJ family response regulator